jgi:ABC-type sugar transport system substrate-binding protein
MSAEKPRLIVSLLDASQEFQRFQAEDAQRTATELGIEIQVLFAENNSIFQIQQLYKALQSSPRPDAVLAETVSGEGLERVARVAVKAGTGWVLINRQVSYLAALRQEHPAVAIGSVSTDQVEIGRLQGRQFRALMKAREGSVLYVQGPPDTSAAQQRLAGAREALQGTAIELKVVEGLWTDESGEACVRRWLRLKRPDAARPAIVGCQNDQMAQGARRALLGVEATPELARVPVTGIDGLPEGGRRLVDVGQLAATVVVPSNAGPAIRLVVDTLRARLAMPEQKLLAPASYPEMTELASVKPSRPAASAM